MKSYKNNPRTLTRKAADKLKADLEEYGDLSGIIHNALTDELIGGNQRSGVMKINECAIELTHEQPADAQGTTGWGYVVWRGNRYNYRRVEWDADKAERANIKANLSAGNWDWAQLAAKDAEALKALGMDEEWKKALDNDALNLKEMLGAEETDTADAEPQIDRAAELNEKWQVKRGDLWRIGEHRLLCGDSTSAEDVARVMDGEKACVFSDAPYGIDIVQNNKVGGGNLAPTGNYAPIVGDKTTDTAKSFYRLCCKLGFYDFILWGGNYFTDFLNPSPCWIVWDKRGEMNSNNFADCELAWTSFDKPARVYKQVWAGMIREGEHDKRVHPTQKPVKITIDIMLDFRFDIYFDGFAGSGTTLVACQNLNRKARAIEISPNYCAVILERMATAFPGIAIERIE